MITATEKIIRFNALQELIDAISKDIQSKDVLAQRYCVRFIMLNDFSTFRELAKILAKNFGVKMYELQNLALGSDKAITIDMLSDAISGITESSLITPFSELVRFYKEEEFNGFFNEIILTEDIKHPEKRIYIPIIGLNNRFNDFLKSFGRIQESAPIWQLYSPDDDKVKVFVTKNKIPDLPEDSEFCVLNSMREWLTFWQKQAPREKILCSARPIRAGWCNSRPDSIFSFAEIKNTHELLTDFLGISVPFIYQDTESEYWDKLFGSIPTTSVNNYSWKKEIEKYFNTWDFSISRILEIWADEKRPAYDRWLLKNYLLHSKQLDFKPYIRQCLEDTTDYINPSVFFVRIAERIFYSFTQAELEKFATERKSLLQQEVFLFRVLVPKTNQEWIRDQLISLAQREEDLNNVKKLCTGTFDFEKELYFGWYLLRENKVFGPSHLKESYPDLYAYLYPGDNYSYYRLGAEWLADYFDAYREAKVKDEYTEKINSYITKYNASDSDFWNWYYKHSTCRDLYHELMSRNNHKPDKVYWIDGLGAEFLPFIQYVVDTAKMNFEIVQAEVATTGLPSNTSLNGFKVDEKTHIKYGDLDQLAHSKHYRARKTLIEELDVIRNIITSILKDNRVGLHTIAIVSDHGLSALSRLKEPHKMTGKTHHEGRYIPLSNDVAAESMSDYITVKNIDGDENYKVALTHSSLGSKPSHEVHGGCTPEEVLVPFIVLTNEEKSKSIKYDYRIVKTELPLSNPLFECIISPVPKTLKVTVDGVVIDMKLTGTKWSGIIPNAKEGDIKVKLTPYKSRGKSFDIKIYGMGMGGSLSDFEL